MRNGLPTEPPAISAKELTVMPKRTVTIRDSAAYGLILTQGHGLFGGHPVVTPSMIRFGEMTKDELFVTAAAAQEGVQIEKPSDTDALVMLKALCSWQSRRRAPALSEAGQHDTSMGFVQYVY